ncbi:serine/threonine-protein kinase RsbW [Caldicoprobacter guelmensis]|nr:serine/threonine-protein kinase RsbW [Caldicoprobacter guelmensis]
MMLLYKKEIVGANPQMVRGLVKEIMECIEAWHHLEEEEDYEFRLIINELIVNGIVHGNKCYEDKILTVIVHALDDTTVSICIRDQGKGFNYKKIERGIFPCDSFLFLERGRGLKIVQSICDDIKFSKNGSWISVKKSIKS